MPKTKVVFFAERMELSIDRLDGRHTFKGEH